MYPIESPTHPSRDLRAGAWASGLGVDVRAPPPPGLAVCFTAPVNLGVRRRPGAGVASIVRETAAVADRASTPPPPPPPRAAALASDCRRLPQREQ
jgi:hypothetical protein